MKGRNRFQQAFPHAAGIIVASQVMAVHDPAVGVSMQPERSGL